MGTRMLSILAAAFALTVWAVNQPAQGYWVTKGGEIDYTCHSVPPDTVNGDGMPDFDQKQDAWGYWDAQNVWHWTWCGPVATANCLWWFDSYFERVRLWSLVGNVNPTMPPAVSDNYSLVYSFGTWDDHDIGNVVPFIQNLVTFLPGGGVPNAGVNATQIKTMIENYLASPSVDLWGHYSVGIDTAPTFDYIYEQVEISGMEISQDVILLLGFWQTDGTHIWRFGGHWLTVAGVRRDTVGTVVYDSISFSDPCKDMAEFGFPGVVWDGFLLLHPPAPHGVGVHNDAGNVSHDYFSIQTGSWSPGGGIFSPEYGYDWYPDDWTNYQGQNVPDRLQSYQGNYDSRYGVHVEIEDLVVVCPNFDYGDLHGAYPTFNIESCGPAHPLTDKAWLGEAINAEPEPDTVDLDNFDDGVVFHNLPWMPCTNVSVTVTVTTGAHYAGEALYLNAWKDGNIDYDFDDGPGLNERDSLCCSEWVIQDMPVASGAYTANFCDPGVFDLGHYDLRMRFRLTSQAVGRFGYGGAWYYAGPDCLGTYDIDWVLGEVEDYIWEDMQLAVELKSFDAVPGDGEVALRWVTASEQDNECFILDRRSVGDWAEITRIPSQGNSTMEQVYEFVDRDLTNGVRYEYRLTGRDVAGTIEELGTLAATPTATVVPVTYALYQNYPNPFNATTAIRFDVTERGFVDLSIFDISGRLVTTLVHEELPASQHTVTFDAADLPSGIYFYRLQAGDFTSAKKMILLK